ncbi:hypothetical protein [Rhodococcus sp. NBC_00294]|uniref:hypothetical protein n=1 Tax=Rhodococcus sp. NBC_00294 TaxID=2976004 RepID=UPI002E285811|nr:hypothetical protein [Rhodococcus sp. NBC_00294]
MLESTLSRGNVEKGVAVESERQRESIIDFYRQAALCDDLVKRRAAGDELAGMLAIWDDACSAHEDPWWAIRNECSMYRFDHRPWSTAATSENFLLTLRAVLEGRGHGLSDAPYEIR